MKRLIRTALLLLALFSCITGAAETIDQMRDRLSKNVYYRLRSYYDTYAVDAGGRTLTIPASGDLTNAWNSIWKIVPTGNGYTFQNVLTEKYLNTPAGLYTPFPTSTTPQTLYIKPSTYQSANNHVVISQHTSTAGTTVAHADGSRQVVFWEANTSATQSNASDWRLEPIANIDQTALENFRAATTPVAGAYYYIKSKEYPAKRIQSPMTETAALAVDANNAEHRQLWQFISMGNGQYALKNAVTGLYIQNNAGQSADFVMGRTAAPFSLNFYTTSTPFYFTAQGTSHVLHAAASQSYHIVGWYSDASASHWILERSPLTTQDIQASINALQGFQNLAANAQNYTDKLTTFFEDAACTTLKPAYRSKSDTDLRNEMAAASLPELLQETAVKVKNQTWNVYNDLANNYEKSFRIAEYKPHSDPNTWARKNHLMRTSFVYSQLTNPTGITANSGETMCIFVDQLPPAGTTLGVELASGNNSTGVYLPLKKGVNFIYPEDKSHLYIRYNITDTLLHISALPKIKIHIEKGRSNGYFDTERHTNQSWNEMLTLKQAGFMQDDDWRMKSKWYTFIFKRQHVENSQNNGEWNYHGQQKGLKDVLILWDSFCQMELDFLSVERFADRFNCPLLATYTNDGGMFATTYGIYGITTLNYNTLAENYENSEGDGIWGLVHETGHHFQDLITMKGALESSNNMFSNIAMWRTGTNVSRGMPLPQLIDACVNQNKSWMDIGLSERIRLYWQLWFYYVELGHKPTFFKELYDKFRNSPMDGANGRTDFLKFAKFCSDVAQEDLTDFFEFYGFFKRTGNNIRIYWGDDFYDKHYAQLFTNVTQTDIDEAKTYMSQYSTKRRNLYFLDERVQPEINKNPYMLPGAPRYATSANATPGDVNEMGSFGHSSEYVAPVAPQPTSVVLDNRTFTMAGEHVVGYKVYNASGQLVYASNRAVFDIPTSVDLSTARIVAAGADGTDVEVYKNGKIVDQYNQPIDNSGFKNTAALALSQPGKQVEHTYYIRLTPNTSAYLNGNTVNTTSMTNRGQFAFYAGTAEGTYYIYSVTANKWLGYTDGNAGTNKITLNDTKAGAVQWKVKKERENGTSVDIMPLSGDNGWNWYGGLSSTRNSMGLYNIGDDQSSWTLIPVNNTSVFEEELTRANDMMARKGPGYPSESSAARRNLSQTHTDFTAAYKAYQAADQQYKANPTDANRQAKDVAYTSATTALNNLKTATTTYTTSKTEIMMPEDGKVYRIKFAHNGNALTNHRMPDNNEANNITLAPCTDTRSYWVCQYNQDGSFYLASLKGNGCINLNASTYSATLTDNGMKLQAVRGYKFGTLYLRGNNQTLMGSTEKTYLQSTSSLQALESDSQNGTDFYFEEVADSAFTLDIKSGNNGNFSTINLPYAVELPEGVKLYQAVKMTGDLEIKEIQPVNNTTGKKVLPAYTPVILSAATSGKLTLQPTMSNHSQVETGMEGTISRIPNSSLQLAVYHYYALTQDNNTFLMRQVRDAAIPANKAYYRVPVSAAPAPPMTLNLVFDETTGIGITEAEKKAEKTYDLSGRPVYKQQGQGVVIVGGKKVIRH